MVSDKNVISQSTSPANATRPVVVGEKPLRALLSIRHDWLLHEMFERIVIVQSVRELLRDVWGDAAPDWVTVHPDVSAELPQRLQQVSGSDRATLQIAVHLNASLVLLDGKALLEKVKLSFIKSMGTIPLLVQAYQEGRIKAIKPLLTALERKGHEMLPADQMTALLRALDELS